MNTQEMGIRATVRGAQERDLPAQTAIALPLIRRLAAAHTTVLENWNRKFALDLRWHRSPARAR